MVTIMVMVVVSIVMLVIVVVGSIVMLVIVVVGLWDCLCNLDAKYLVDLGHCKHLLFCHVSINFLLVISFVFRTLFEGSVRWLTAVLALKPDIHSPASAS